MAGVGIVLRKFENNVRNLKESKTTKIRFLLKSSILNFNFIHIESIKISNLKTFELIKLIKEIF